MQQFDVLIIGSGLAGLTIALRTAAHKKVCLVSKRSINDSASDWAQGGIAAVLNDEDSIENHIQDTLIAGAGLCDEAVTKMVAEHAKEAVEWLIEQGVGFTRDHDNSGFHLTREGGHSHRRIIHAADTTGHAVQVTLSDKVKQHPNITVMENHIAVDLITARKLNIDINAETKFQTTDYNTDANPCLGAYVLDKSTGKVITITGGKLTTYREMAEDTVDAVLHRLDRKARCRTRNLPLLGAAGFREPKPGAPDTHLANRFGTLANEVRSLIAVDPSLGEPLVAGLPYLRAEAVYAVRNEMALSLDDVLTRRTRARIFDRGASLTAAPAVAALLAAELGWDTARTAEQLASFTAQCEAEEHAAVTAEVVPST